jgi:hypothetical protein
MIAEASLEAPIYRCQPESGMEPSPGPSWMVCCDEGWRESIVCGHMYEWAARWLVARLGRIPYATEFEGRP